MAKNAGSLAAARLNMTRERLALEENTRRGLELYAKASAELEKADARKDAAGKVIQSEDVAKAKDYSVGQHIAGTAMDVVGQIIEGVGRTTEGLVDGTVGLIGVPVMSLVDALSGADVRRDIRAFIERDYVSEWGGSMVDALSDWTNIDPREASAQPKLLQDVEEGVGGMLPAVAVSAIPYAGPILSMIVTGVSAGGKAMQSAYQEGAGDWQGLGYGVASGAIEAGTEKMFSGATKFTYGKGWLDNVVPAVGTKGVTRVLKAAVEEGAEEVVSELAQPVAKTIYKGSEALGEYGTGDYWKGVGESFVVGGATSVLYAGTAGYGLSKAGYGHTGRAADVDALLSDIEGLKRKEQNARKHYKLTPELSAEIDTQIKNRYQDIETVLAKAKPGRRAEIIETFSLEKAVDADGKLTADFRRRLGMEDADEAAPGGAEAYTYKSLTSKPNMPVTTVDDAPRYNPSAETRKNIIDRAMKNAASFGRTNESGNAVIHVDDIDADVIVGRNGIKHGLDRRLNVMAPVALNIGPILKNAVRINELNPRSENIKDSYVLIGVAKNQQNQPYVVEFVVNRHTNEITAVDVLYSFNAKDVGINKKSGADRALAPRVPAEADYVTDPNISIAHLLDFVNRVYPDILPQDVLTHYGHTERPKGTLGESARYSKNGQSTTRQSGNRKQRLHPQFYKGDARRILRALDAAGREAVTDPESLSATERKNYKEFLRAAEMLDDVSSGTFDFVIVESTDRSTGAYVAEEDVILISRETLQSTEKTAEALRDGWLGVTVEEALHKSAANSNFHDSYYRRFFDLMTSDKKAVKNMLGELVGLGYFGDNISEARQTVDRLTHKKAENMTAAELEQRNMLYDELVAHLGRDALSTEHFYRRLIETDKNAAQRFLDALRRLTRRAGKKSGKVEAQIDEWALLQEELFLAAVHEAGGEVNENGKIVGVNDEEETTEVRNSFEGYAEDGKGKYRSNFPKGTPKKAKGERILHYIQDVWSKKPIPLNITDDAGNIVRTIQAQFDPQFDEKDGVKSDASKLMGGNRHGTASEQRVTLDLADDYYQIASEANYNYSKNETGKTSVTHQDVREWHYFVNDIYFAEQGSENFESYTITINVKERNDGQFVYSFSAEKSNKSSTRRTLHADVSRGESSTNAEPVNNSISQTQPSVNPSEKKTSTVRESKKKTSPTEPIGTDRSTYELYQNVEQLVSGLMYEEAGGGAYFDGKLSEHLKGTVWQRIKQAVNVSDKRHLSEKLADEILNASVIEYVAGGEMQGFAMQERDILRRYLHKLDVGAWKSDLVSVFGEDGYKSLRARWGMAKKGTAMAPDSIKAELEGLLGYPIEAEHPAEIVEWMENKWKTVNDATTSDSKAAVADMKGSEEYGQYRQAIADELYIKLQEVQWDAASEHLSEYYKSAYDLAWKSGKDRVDAYMQKEGGKLRRRDAERREKEATTHWLNKAAAKAAKIKSWKSAEFLAASQVGNQKLLGALGELSKVTVQGNVSITGTRKAIKKVLEWYRQEDTRKMLAAYKIEGSDKYAGGMYSSEIEGMLENLAASDDGSTKAFTSKEARDLCKVLDYFKHVVEHVHMVYRNGKWVKVKDASEDYQRKVIGRAFNLRQYRGMIDLYQKYKIEFNDPAHVMRYFDGFAEHGFLTDSHESFRHAETETAYIKHGMAEQIRKFEQEHKGYFNQADKQTVTVSGQEGVPLMAALYIYEALGRDQAVRHLMANGYQYLKPDGQTARAPALMPGFTNDMTMVDMQPFVDQVRGEIMSQLSDADKAFLKVAEKLFNEDCKNYKRDTDMKLYGYSNVIDGLYVPIRIADTAQRVDTADYRSEMDRATNASFNKTTVERAKNSIVADSLIDVLMRHVDGVARYAGMSEAIIAYEMILSVDTGGNLGSPMTVNRAYEHIWKEHTKYFKDMINDMQGIPVGKGPTTTDRVLDWMRGKYAVAVLGANPKVLATQFSSLIASTSILDPKYVAQGLPMKADTKALDEYCHLAMLRNADNTAVRAQSVTDKISEVGEFMTGAIGKTDRLVITRLWNACLLQCAAENHLEINSEANRQKAGELLARVIYETQQNAQATEKSAAMRGSAFNKMFTMFTADAMKTTGRVLDAVGEYRATRKNKEFPHLYDDAKHKAAKQKLSKALGAMGMQALYMAIVATAFRKLIARDEEDTWKEWSWDDLGRFVGDAFSSMIGGLPLISDVAEFFMSGFDMEDMGVGAINDLLKAVSGIGDILTGIVSGQISGEQIATKIRLLFYALGNTTGIPAQNTYKYLRGAVYTLGGDTGEEIVYRVDSVFKTPNYAADIGKAIGEGDEDRVEFLTGLALDERVSLAKNSAVRKELVSLANTGASILPRSVGTTVTYDGTEYSMTVNQQKRFREVYEGANEAVLRLVQSSYYAAASDSVKAKAIARVYKLYYNLAIEDLLGVEMEQRIQLYAKAIPPEKLAIIVAEADELKADLNESGQPITGSRRKKVADYVNRLKLTAAQKYMVFSYLGYKTVNGHEEVKRYINSLDISREGKETLLEDCGID